MSYSPRDRKEKNGVFDQSNHDARYFGLVEHADNELASVMVNATIDVFKQVVHKLLPTPAKVHYTFNLRDLAKVC